VIGEETAAVLAAPPSASARGTMIAALPPIYREGPGEDERAPLIERWLGALESVLDPVVALLDNLPAHLDPAMAPDDLVDLLCLWVGMPPLAAVPLDAKRRLLAHAAEISDRRGTLAGLQDVLDLAFPGAGIKATHNGAITTGGDPRAGAPAAPDPEIVVTAPGPLDAGTRLALEALIEDQRPAHVTASVADGAPGAA
jgi:phage tail-like protein